MAISSERSISQEINTWVQIIGIIIGSGWGVYTFIYKEIWIPKSAPVNVTVDLQLKKIERPNSQQMQDKKQGLTAIEMEITATNPSSRIVYLLSSRWTAYGINVDIRDEDPELANKIPTTLNSQKVAYIEKYAKTGAASSDIPVAIGNAFSDNSIKPNEKLTRKIIFHIPSRKFDLIDVVVQISSMGLMNGAIAEWGYNKGDGFLLNVYRIAENGARIAVDVDENGYFIADTKLELQTNKSESMLSLWQ